MWELNAQRAREINLLIDKYHDPYWWSLFGILSLVFLLEIFLPVKKQFENWFDKVLTDFKLFILFFCSLILISQGFLGGCVVQIPQNWLAQKYLDLPYWYPYGLVYRENFPESFWPFLRLIYILLALLFFYLTYLFYYKRVRLPNQALKKERLNSRSYLIKTF